MAETASWFTDGNSLLMTIKGTAVPTTLVSNTHLSPSGSTTTFTAQSFETGANTGGYTVSEVDMRLGVASGRSASVKIREDADNEPGDLVATLTNPGTLTAQQSQHVYGAGRHNACCEHYLLDNRERGNLIQQGVS